MVKIALIGLTCMFLCVTLGGIKREYAIFVAVAGCFLIFYLGISQMEFITKTMYELQSVIGINGTYISILLKMVGIAYLAEFASSLCKDAGQGAIAGQIDFVGKITMIVISLPILESLLRTLGEFLP